MALALTTLGLKIHKALEKGLSNSLVRVDDEGGISGIVLSPEFDGMAMLDRQEEIANAIESADDPFTPEERRRIGMFFAFTPREFRGSELRVRVTEVREVDGGIEIYVGGGRSSAEYARLACSGLEDVKTTEPKSSPGIRGQVWGFLASSTATEHLTKAKVIEYLKGDPFLKVLRDL